LRSTGLVIIGGTAAVGLPVAISAAPAATAGGPAAAGDLAGARRLGYRAVAEIVAGVRCTDRGTDVAMAEERLADWYAKATGTERAEIDKALDAATEVLDAMGRPAPEARDRAIGLAKHLTGRYERPLTFAIGLAVGGLAGERSRPADPYAAGRLYTRLIRALPAQRGPGRTMGSRQLASGPEPCRQQVG
jgi:hypothetical protein